MTRWTAAALGYLSQLGAPWFRIGARDAFGGNAVLLCSADVLRREDEDWATDDEVDKLHGRRSAADLKEQLSQELVVPSRSLKIT